MTLVKFEPFREIESLQNHLQSLFSDFPTFGLDLPQTFSPRVDISENDKNLFIDAEIPGVDKKDLKITLQDNILTVEGEKKILDERKENDTHRTERIYGSFKRSFTLPENVDPDKIDAQFKDGVLHITLKKVEPKEAKEKVIKVK